MSALFGVLTSVVLSALTGWLFWGPIRGFMFSMIPLDATHAWAGKLLIMIVIAWFGGIALPIFIFFLGLYVSLNLSK